jgi:cysteine synthase
MSHQANVFSGPDALWEYIHPDFGPPTPLVELPQHPFRSHGVRIYAKMLSQQPLANVKGLPAMNMLEKARSDRFITEETKEIVEYSR